MPDSAVDQLERVFIEFKMLVSAITSGIRDALERATERGDLSDEAAERLAEDIVATLDKQIDVRASGNA